VRLTRLDPVIEKLVGVSDISIIITFIGLARSGLPVARATVWSGRVLACRVAELDKASEHSKLAKEASSADREPRDKARILRAIERLGEPAHA
jgi:hypothetical protein